VVAKVAIPKSPMEKFLRKIRVIGDDLDKAEVNRRKRLFTHIAGGLIGIVIMLILMEIFRLDGIWSLSAGALGKGSIDYADFLENV